MMEVSARVKRRKLNSEDGHDSSFAPNLSEWVIAKLECLHSDSLVLEYWKDVSAKNQEGMEGRRMRNMSARQLITALRVVSASIRGGTASHCVCYFGGHCLELAPAFFGVLDAGRTFVPIDPPTAISSYDRTMSLIKATGCSTILVPHSFMSIASYSQFITTLSNEIGAQIIELRIDTDNTLMLVPLGDSQIDSLAIGPAPPSLPLPSSTYAYAIATSGTTGEPKIVWVPHASAQSNAEAIAQYWNLGQQDSHLMIAPVTFDPWIIDICVTLGCGAKLVMVEDTIRHNSAKLAALLPRMLLSSIQCTPSYLWSLGSDGITSLLATARNVSLGGEPFPMRHQVLSWLGPSAATRRRDIRFFNLYGITEMSIWATIEELTVDALENLDDESICIGWPLPDTQLLLVDPITNDPLALLSSIQSSELELDLSRLLLELEGNEIIPLVRDDIQNLLERHPPVIDEAKLFIGGKRRSCAIQQQTSHQDLSPHPPITETYWKDTGDHVRLVEDKLLYLGRVDGTQKVAGKRVHPTEVAALLSRSPYVKDVFVWFDRVSSSPQHTPLLATPIEPRAGSLGVLPRLLAAVYAAKDPTMSHNNDESKAALVIQRHLQEWKRSMVPDFMRPADILITFDPLPTTKHGKVDTKALERMARATKSSNTATRATIRDALQQGWERIIPHLTTIKDPIEDAFLTSYGASSIEVLRCADDVLQTLHLDPTPERVQSLSSKLFNNSFKDVLRYLEDTTTSPHATISAAEPINGLNESAVSHHYTSTISGALDDAVIAVNQRASTCFYQPIVRGVAGMAHSWRLELQWRVFLGKCIDASPVVLTTASGKSLVVVGSHSGTVGCIDGSTGEFVWKVQLKDERIEAAVTITPKMDMALVSGYSGSVHVLNVADGQCIRSVEVSKSEIKAAVTCDSNDTAWVGCHDRRVVCFNYSTKDILFQYETGAPIFASVVMDTVNKIVAVASEDGYLYGFNNAPPFGLIWQCNVKSPIFATPVFDPSRECFFVTTVGGALVRVSSYGERKLLLKLSSPIYSSPLLTKDFSKVIFGCHDSSVYCISTSAAVIGEATQWRAVVSGPVFSAPYCTVLPDQELDMDEYPTNEVVWVTTIDGTLVGLNGGSGAALVSTPPMTSAVFSSPVCFSCGDVNSAVFGARDDHLYCFVQRSNQ